MTSHIQLIIACERSGIIREAFRAKGVNAWSSDISPAEDLSLYHFRGDAIAMMKRHPRAGKIIHPPCTRLANSGALRLYNMGKKEYGIDPIKWEELLDAAEFFHRCFAAAGEAPFAVENPIQHHHAVELHGQGKADQIIRPWQFGDDASKATCLWLRNGLPPLLPTKVYPPRIVNGHKRWSNQTDSGQNKLAPSNHRAMDRARTYPGIAKAMADQWTPYFINL